MSVSIDKVDNIDNRSKEPDIDEILQQMGKLLSPAGDEDDNSVYKQVIETSNYKSMEDILNEAKGLVKISNVAEHNIISENINQNALTFKPDVNISVLKSKPVIKTSLCCNEKLKIISNMSTEKRDLDKVTRKINSVTSVNARKGGENVIQAKKLNLRLNNSTGKGALSINKDLTNSIAKYKVIPKKKINSDRNNAIKSNLQSDTTDNVITSNELYPTADDDKRKFEQIIYKLEKNQRNTDVNAYSEHGKSVFHITKEDIVFCQKYIEKSEKAYSNLKCLFDIAQTEWKKVEEKLLKENQSLRHQLERVRSLPSNTELLEEKLKDVEELNVKLKNDYENMKEKNRALESLCNELQKKVKLLEEYEGVQNKALTLSIANTPSSSSNAFPPSASDKYVVKLQNKLERIKKDIKSLSKSLETTQENLVKEQNKVKELSREKEQLQKENMDYKRQIKELENIMYKRSRNDSSIFSGAKSATLPSAQEREYMKKLRDQLEEKVDTITSLRSDLSVCQEKYVNRIRDLKSELAVARLEIWKLKEELKKKMADSISARYKSQQNTTATAYKACGNEMEILHLRNQEVQLQNDNEMLAKEKEKYVQLYESLFTSTKDNSAIQFGASLMINNYDVEDSEDDCDSPKFTDNFDVNKEKLAEIYDNIGNLEEELTKLQRKEENKPKRLFNSYTHLHKERSHHDESSSLTNLQRQLGTQNNISNYLNEQKESALHKIPEDTSTEKTVRKKQSTINDASATCHSVSNKAGEVAVQKNTDPTAGEKTAEMECANRCRQKIYEKNLQICQYKKELDQIIDVIMEFKKKRW